MENLTMPWQTTATFSPKKCPKRSTVDTMLIECNTSSTLRAKLLNSNMDLNNRDIKPKQTNTPTSIARRLLELCDSFEREEFGSTRTPGGRGVLGRRRIVGQRIGPPESL
ncbi:hypothetical protein KIN20_034892 [Parelaphostrongylus tenuis]|uniref:Uncharacterized protein n=1 Tax=Parelaphostrongylus tenuis TaxID=148309 RepID=A0AAD5WKE7_PARTN|nr:hypothetical protein KIN20_034892 [Parelaphostrongylus tenuis]